MLHNNSYFLLIVTGMNTNAGVIHMDKQKCSFEPNTADTRGRLRTHHVLLRNHHGYEVEMTFKLMSSSDARQSLEATRHHKCQRKILTRLQVGFCSFLYSARSCPGCPPRPFAHGLSFLFRRAGGSDGCSSSPSFKSQSGVRLYCSLDCEKKVPSSQQVSPNWHVWTP